MSKKSPVPVQRGKITPAWPPTRKMQTRMEKEMEDSANGALRKSGMTLSMHTPKI